MTKNSKISTHLVNPMKRFAKDIVFCIGFIQLMALPAVAQSRSLEWERAYVIHNDNQPGNGYKKARCDIDLVFSGQKYKLNCLTYSQFKAKLRFIHFFPDPSENQSGVTGVLFLLNEDLSPIALGLQTDKGVLQGTGKLICKELSESSLVGTICGANVILQDGRPAMLVATVLMKM